MGGYTCDFYRALATRQFLKKLHHLCKQKKRTCSRGFNADTSPTLFPGSPLPREMTSKTIRGRLHAVPHGSHVGSISMSVVFVRRWLVAFFIAIGIILIVAFSLRKVRVLFKSN